MSPPPEGATPTASSSFRSSTSRGGSWHARVHRPRRARRSTGGSAGTMVLAPAFGTIRRPPRHSDVSLNSPAVFLRADSRRSLPGPRRLAQDRKQRAWTSIFLPPVVDALQAQRAAVAEVRNVGRDSEVGENLKPW